MESRYHRAALGLLGRPAALPGAGLAEVAARERALGFLLPAAVREWYALEAGQREPPAYGNDDAPVALARLGEELARPPGVGCDLLVLMHENQGACTWAAPLDGSDDPPVLVQVDGRRWQLYVPSFSAFNYVRVWDGLVLASCRLAAQDRSLASADLARLRRAFTELHRSKGWPAQVQYRFERGGQRLLIVDDEVGQADWYLAADGERALADLVTEVRDIGTLARTLRPRPRTGRTVEA